MNEALYRDIHVEDMSVLTKGIQPNQSQPIPQRKDPRIIFIEMSLSKPVLLQSQPIFVHVYSSTQDNVQYKDQQRQYLTSLLCGTIHQTYCIPKPMCLSLCKVLDYNYS